MARKKAAHKKGKTKKNRIGAAAKTSIANLWGIRNYLPDRLRNKMKYTEIISFNPAVGVYQEHVYRMNSIYDPNYTGAGGQPTGFDQFATFYQTYRVFESVIRVRYLPTAPAAGSDASTGALVVYPSQTATGVTYYADAVSTPYSRNTNYGFYAGSTGSSVLYNKMAIATIAGASKTTVANEDNFAANVASNPVNAYYWVIGNSNQSSATQDVDVQVELEFYVEWSTKVMLNQS